MTDAERMAKHVGDIRGKQGTPIEAATWSLAAAVYETARAFYQLVEQGQTQDDPFHLKGGVPLMAPVEQETSGGFVEVGSSGWVNPDQVEKVRAYPEGGCVLTLASGREVCSTLDIADVVEALEG